jgi:hypothetical protein
MNAAEDPIKLDQHIEQLLRQHLGTQSHPASPVDFARSLGIDPDPWQAQVLTSTNRRLILNCSRQSGKSTSTAILALHRALTRPGVLILLVSPSDRQSSELFRKVTGFIGHLTTSPRLREDNRRSVEFANGSRIVSLPSSEATIRGFSAVHLLIVDEAADVDDEIFQAIRPMLIVSKGQLIMMGTPKGRRGYFFEMWERGGEAWERIQVRATDVPHERIAPEDLAEEKRTMGQAYLQEYNCEFVNLEAGRVYPNYDETRNDLDSLGWKHEPTLWTWILGMDFGVVDSTAFCVIGWRKHSTITIIRECYKIPGMIAPDAAQEAKKLDASYHFERIVGDSGGLGKAFTEEMRRRHHIPVVGADKQNKLGYVTLLNGALKEGTLKIVKPACLALAEEWIRLHWSDGPLRRIAAGQEDHCADATLYAWRAAQAYLEEDAPSAGPAPGSHEAHALEADRLLQEHIDRSIARANAPWWEDSPRDGHILTDDRRDPIFDE